MQVNLDAKNMHVKYWCNCPYLGMVKNVDICFICINVVCSTVINYSGKSKY